MKPPIEYQENKYQERALVELKNVSITLGGRTVLEDVSLSIGEGKLVGVVGPNGAGKTSLLRAIIGLVKPSNGDVYVFGLPAEKLGRKLGLIGYLPQRVDFENNFPISVRDVVMMGRAGNLGFLHYPRAQDYQVVEESLWRVGLEGYGNRQIGELSGGERQRVLLARALTGNPRLLLLDEPTSGLDLLAQEQFYTLLEELRCSLSLTVIVVSHDLEEIITRTDELIFINKRLIFDGEPGRFKSIWGLLNQDFGGMGVSQDARDVFI